MANIRYKRLTTLLTPQSYNIIFLSFKLQWYLLYFKDHCICFSPVPYFLGTLQHLSVSITSLLMKTRLVPCIFAVFVPWEIKISSVENEKPVRTPRKVRLNRIASLIVNGRRDRLRLTPDCISLGFYYKHRTTEITRPATPSGDDGCEEVAPCQCSRIPAPLRLPCRLFLVHQTNRLRLHIQYVQQLLRKLKHVEMAFSFDSMFQLKHVETASNFDRMFRNFQDIETC